jgi:hypothetical protein
MATGTGLDARVSEASRASRIRRADVLVVLASLVLMTTVAACTESGGDPSGPSADCVAPDPFYGGPADCVPEEAPPSVDEYDPESHPGSDRYWQEQGDQICSEHPELGC